MALTTQDKDNSRNGSRLSDLAGKPKLLLSVIASLVMLPALLFGAMAGGVDSIFHARWQQSFATQLWTGDLIPRWLIDLNGGFGSPAFFIYPPFSHYVTALLHPLLPQPGTMALRLGISCWAAMVLSGLACFYWLQRALPGRRGAALLGALVYLLAPYHLYIDVYQRGAFAEVWAFLWPPLTLAAIEALREFSARRLAVLILTVAGLMTTHAPSAVIFLPAYVVYAATIAAESRRIRPLAWCLTGIAGGLMLSGFYLGTALTHTANIDSAALFAGRNLASHWLLGGPAWPDPAMATDITVAAAVQGVAALLLAGSALLWAARGSRRLPMTALLLAVIPLALMSAFSRPIWSLGLPIERVQFPWRFLSLLTLAGALSMSAFVARFGAISRAAALMAAAVPVVFLATNLALMSMPDQLPASIGAVPPPADPFAQSWDAPEYQFAKPDDVAGVFGKGERAQLVSGAGTVTVTQWQPRALALTVEFAEPSVIAIHQFAYPGWTIMPDANNTGAKLTQGKPYLQAEVQPGRHVIALELARMPAETAGDVASLIAALIVVGLLVFGGPRKPEANHR